MMTWEEFCQLEVPKARREGAGICLDIENKALLITAKSPAKTGPFTVSLSRDEAVTLRDFLNQILPPEKQVSPREYPPTEEHVGSSVKPEAETSASAQTAKDMVEDLDKKQEPTPQGAADPGDEEVPVPGEEPEPQPAAPADKGTALMVEEITKLIKDFCLRDTNAWSATDPVFINHKTTEAEVLLGNVTDKETLRSIRDQLAAEWRKRSEKFNNPLRDKPNGRRKK